MSRRDSFLISRIKGINFFPPMFLLHNWICSFIEIYEFMVLLATFLFKMIEEYLQNWNGS